VLPAHHVLIRSRAARNQDVLERDTEAMGHIAECLPLAGPNRHDVEELAEGVDDIDR
jgi:hypothetical protein